MFCVYSFLCYDKTYLYHCRYVLVGMGDRRPTLPPVVKTAYLLHRKSCARFGFNFSLVLLRQVINSDEKDTRHVYLLEKYMNKSLVNFY